MNRDVDDDLSARLRRRFLEEGREPAPESVLVAVHRRLARPKPGTRPVRSVAAGLAAASVVAAVIVGGWWTSGTLIGARVADASPSATAVTASDAVAPTGTPAATARPSDGPVPEATFIARSPRAIVAWLSSSDRAPWWSPGRVIEVGPGSTDAEGTIWVRPAEGEPMIPLAVHGGEVGDLLIGERTAPSDEPTGLGCVAGSRGSYRVARVAERVDIEVVADDCAGRTAAIAGTWQAVSGGGSYTAQAEPYPWVWGSFPSGRSVVLLGSPMEAIAIEVRDIGVAAFSRPSWDRQADRAHGLWLSVIQPTVQGSDPAAASPGGQATPGPHLTQPVVHVRVAFPLNMLARPCRALEDPPGLTPITTVDDVAGAIEAAGDVRVERREDSMVDGVRIVRLDLAGAPGGACDGTAFRLWPFDPAVEPRHDDAIPADGIGAGSLWLAEVEAAHGPAIVALTVGARSDPQGDAEAAILATLRAITWDPAAEPPAI